MKSLFGPKYDDARLTMLAKNAIAEDPLVTDHGNMTISSSNGVLTLTGIVHKRSEKDRVEGVVRETLQHVGIKFDRITNDLKLIE
jgi:osmotically-inducible protein OsmY